MRGAPSAALTLGFALALAGPSAVRAAPTVDDAYYQGTEAFRAGDLDTALARFEEVRRRIDPAHALYAPIHYNLGRCAELMVERGHPDPPVCEGAAWFETFLSHADDQRSEASLARARAGMALLAERCALVRAPEPPPPPPPAPVVEAAPAPPPSDGTRWWLAGGALAAAAAGGVALYFAADADAEADAAHARYRDAATEAEAEPLADAVRGHEADARTRSLVGLAALAGAAGLGIAALLVEDDAPAAALRIAPGHIGAAWRF